MGIFITVETVEKTKAEICEEEEIEECMEYVRKLIEKRTKIEQEIDECCELGWVLEVMTGKQIAELEDFCFEELDFQDCLWDAAEKMDDEKYKILKQYVYGHLTIGQVIDLYLEITTVED